MPENVMSFLRSERVGVLAVQLPNGSPHAATVHYSHKESPLQFIVLTSPNSRKFELLNKNGSAPASLVIGVNEETMRTLQLDGIVEPDDTQESKDAYLKKFPSKDEDFKGDVFVRFTPSWWRFTDWTLPEGKTIFDSDGKVVVGS